MARYLLVAETMPSMPMQRNMWRALGKQGMAREDCEIIAILGDGKPRGSYQKVTAAQRRTALPEFYARLAEKTARFVLPLGGPAFRALTGLDWKITSANAYILRPADCRKVTLKRSIQIGTYKTSRKGKYKQGDPKYADRRVGVSVPLPIGCEYIIPALTIESVHKLQFRNIDAFCAPFKHAVDIDAGEPLLDEGFMFSVTPPPPGRSWQGTVAYDLEVPFDSTAVERASLADATGCWSFPWGPDAVRAMREALADADQRVAHNQQFDIPILEHHGIEVPEPSFDSMLAAALIQPELPKGLDAVAPLYLRLAPWKHLSKDRGFADPEYSAKDAFVERALGVVLQRKLEELGMDSLFNDRIMPSVRTLADMKTRGIRIDPMRAERWCAELDGELTRLQKQWHEEVSSTINPFSSQQLQDLFYGEWGLPVQRRKGDGVSTDKLALAYLRTLEPSRSEAFDVLLALRATRKNLKTYGRTALGVDFLHPSYLPVTAFDKTSPTGYGKGLAGTGRISCSKPNLQNQPPVAKHLYIPDRPDMCFVSADWSQAELRVGAAMSEDEAMLAALQGDLHAHTMELLGCDRTRAKNVLFGSGYGAGPQTIHEVLFVNGVNVPVAECAQLQRSLARAYPAWWAWRERVVEQAKLQKYLRNPFGRIRIFPLEKHAPAALDYHPQSTVGDMAWTCYRQVNDLAAKFDGRLTTVVHDDFVAQVPATAVQEFVPAFRAVLEQTFPEVTPGFYCPVGIKVGAPGASWADLEEYER